MSPLSLVTGGAGFIGSNLVRALIARQNMRVIVIDDFSTGRRDNLPRSDRLSVVEGDLATLDGLDAIAMRCRYVFHLAAQVGNLRSIEDPIGDARSNIQGTVRLLAACRGTSIRKVVVSSSAATFGEVDAFPISEDERQEPVSFYALSKLTAERYALLAVSLLQLPVVCLRYFNVYGSPVERSDYAGVIAAFIERLQANDTLTIYGDGEQVRDFVYVKDVVAANLLAAERGIPGAVFNIGTGTATTVTQLAEMLAKLMGRAASVEYLPFRAGEVRRSVASIARASAELGYQPAFDLRAGLQDMLDADFDSAR